MAIDTSQAMLILQRAAVIRAIEHARRSDVPNDAEILQTVVHLLEELHEFTTWKIRQRNGDKS